MFSNLPQWVKHVLYVVVVGIVAFSVGRFSTPEKKIEIETTTEFKSAVEKQVKIEVERETTALRASLEQEWQSKVKTVFITKPDGTKVETKVVENSGKKVEIQVKEVIKEVEVVKEVVVEKVVEKIVEKQIFIENHPNWALGVTIQPLPLFIPPTDYLLGLSLERRVLGGIWATIGIQSSIKEFTPTYTLGVRIEL